MGNSFHVRFLADIELLLENLDKTEFHSNVRNSAFLVNRHLSMKVVPDPRGHTSMVPRAVPLTVTVKFLPGSGGSGETSIDSSWIMS